MIFRHFPLKNWFLAVIRPYNKLYQFFSIVAQT